MVNKEKNILFAGGKTGGHLFPGIAVAEKLKGENRTIIFVGSSGGLEERIVPECGYDLEMIMVGGLKGKSFVETIKNLIKLPVAIFQSKKILKKHSVDVVVSLGGYAAGPVAVAAKLLKIPVVVMEQNSIPGITNKMIARFAKKIYTTFTDQKNIFPPEKVLLSGNPVRNELFNAKPFNIKTDKPVLAIFGGSQGARSLNNMVLYTLEKYPDLLKQFYFVHQTGEHDFYTVSAFYKDKNVPHYTARFIMDIGNYYKTADYVICRAGATTITELLAFKKPAIYVPFPYAADNHQYFNAVEIEKKGGGIVVEDQGSDTNKGKKLYKALTDMLENRDEFTKNMNNFPENNAADIIARDILKIVGE